MPERRYSIVTRCHRVRSTRLSGCVHFCASAAVVEPEPNDALDAGLGVARALERHGVSYALGGALAYGVWAIPRATVDVDVNVFARDDELGSVFDAFESLNIAVDREAAVRTAADRGLFVLQWGMFRIDVFTPSIAFSWEAARTRIAHEIEGQRYFFLSPEALAVFKLLFFRGKDIVDLERLLAVQGDKLDRAYIRRNIVEMMGEADDRVRRWDELVQTNSSPPTPS
jgi:hypothetical protein